MNLQDIKELVAEEGGKVIIVERDAVVAVVLSHEAYRTLKAGTRPLPSAAAAAPQIPRAEDLSDLQEPDELTIDDLPL